MKKMYRWCGIMVLICLIIPFRVKASSVLEEADSSGNITESFFEETEELEENKESEELGESGEEDYIKNTMPVEYYDMVLEEKNKISDYYIYRAQLNVQLAELQIEYLKSVESEWNERLAIEEKKLELGYSIPVRVEEVRNQQASVQRQINEAVTLKEYYMDTIELYGGQYEEVQIKEWFPITETYMDSFEENSSQIFSYETQMENYKEIIEVIGTENENAQIYKKQLKIVKLSLEQYKINLELYVKELKMKHNNLGQEIVNIDNQIKVQNSKIENGRKLLEKGKITKIELVEMENELSRLQYERMSLLCDVQTIYYILTNQIENQSI